VPPHSQMRVASLDVSANFDLAVDPVPRQSFTVAVNPEALTGADTPRNWAHDQLFGHTLTATAWFYVQRGRSVGVSLDAMLPARSAAGR
jgi:hypothetical protein